VFSGQGRAVVDGTSIVYTPNGFVGSDEVVYQVSDGKGGTAIAMLLFTVSDATPNNTVPTAQGKTYTFSLSTALTAPEQTLNLSPLVDDTDGDELTLTNVVGAVNPV
ncbi:Ig-like domain-containing protein, partial [Shewanella sp. 10N.261.52.F9]|uniref:Ig-like domain-containing protein n=1 Tax=Shewanella sp. 10N.261.52.F9 TaxID=3229684 RepID=UPI00354ADC23